MISNDHSCKENTQIHNVDDTENAEQNNQSKHRRKHGSKAARLYRINDKIYP